MALPTTSCNVATESHSMRIPLNLHGVEAAVIAAKKADVTFIAAGTTTGESIDRPELGLAAEVSIFTSSSQAAYRMYFPLPALNLDAC